MGTLSLKTATVDDAVCIGLNLRPGDVREVMAGRDQHPITTVVESFLASDEAYTVHDSEDGPIAIWGFHGVGKVAIPWLLATPQSAKHGKEFYYRGLGYTKYMLSKFEVLVNFVHAKNRPSIKWLQRIGYRLVEYVPEWGDTKSPFFLFTITRTPQCASQPQS